MYYWIPDVSHGIPYDALAFWSSSSSSSSFSRRETQPNTDPYSPDTDCVIWGPYSVERHTVFGSSIQHMTFSRVDSTYDFLQSNRREGKQIQYIQLDIWTFYR